MSHALANLSQTGSAKPRRHHFLFAHRFLPRLWWNDGAREVTAILAEDGAGGLTEALCESWASIGAQLDESERLIDDGLTADCFDLGRNYRAVIVTLPKAECRGEATLASLVWRSPRRRFFVLHECPIVRFFTVELARVGRVEASESRMLSTPVCTHLAPRDGPSISRSEMSTDERATHELRTCHPGAIPKRLYETTIEGIRLAYDEPPPETPADFLVPIQQILNIGPS